MKNTFQILIFIQFLAICLTSCGGGGSSDNGVLITGTLTEGAGVAHSALVKHEAGEKLAEVQICALGECSTTDGQGQWGFSLSSDFAGGDVLFTIKGHGIDANASVNIPSSANDIELDFQHFGGAVTVDHITIDGVTQHLEGESHGHDDEVTG